MIASGLVAVLMPIVGLWSDRRGRRPMLIASNILLVLVSYPLFMAVQASPVFGTVVAVQCAFGVVLSLITAPMVPLASEMFPTIGRSTGMSVGFALPLAVFGTCAPLIVTWMIMATGNSLAPALYIMVAGLIATVGLSLIRTAPREAV